MPPTAASHSAVHTQAEPRLLWRGRDVEQLRRRVLLYLKVMFFLHIGLGLAGGGLKLLLRSFRPEMWLEPRNAGVMRFLAEATILLLGLAWLGVRKVKLSAGGLTWAESIATLTLSLGYAQYLIVGPGHSITIPTVLMLSLLSLVLRAGLVPSRKRRTVLLGVLSVAVVLAFIYFKRPVDILFIGWLGVLASAFIVVTAVISHVIYGLRQQVVEARRLGQYDLGLKLGEGAMGVVYQATHIMLRRPTAVKLLPSDKAGEEAIARFEREVQQTSRLEHPNTVAIYDYGRTPKGVFYYAMEYITGITLEELVEMNGPLRSGRVVHLLKQASHALAEAHGKGLVHRDLKPANIMVCDRAGIADLVKVLDFGLVKPLPSSNVDEARVTKADKIVGTPHYMAPEAFMDPENINAAADVYGLACMAFYLLTGREVFEGKTLMLVASKHMNNDPPRPSEFAADVDAGLEDLIMRCLVKDPTLRLPNGAALAEELEQLTCSWSRQDARGWWHAHASAINELHASKKASASGRPPELDIDLSDRAA